MRTPKPWHISIENRFGYPLSFGEDHSQVVIRPWPEVDTCKKGEVLAKVLFSSRKPKGLVFFATPILHLEFLCSAL